VEEFFNGACITVSAMLNADPQFVTSSCLMEPAGDKAEETLLLLGSLSPGTSASTEFQPSGAETNGML
jgi:hypothetical protein